MVPMPCYTLPLLLYSYQSVHMNLICSCSDSGHAFGSGISQPSPVFHSAPDFVCGLSNVESNFGYLLGLNCD